MEKVVKVVCFLFDPNIGGPTIRARKVSTRLSSQNVSVSFAIPRTDGTARSYLEEKGFTVTDLGIPKPVLPKKLGAFIWFVLSVPVSLIKLVMFLRSERPDVIHINGAFDVLPAIAGRLSGVPVLWHLNDTLFNTKLSRLLGAFVGRVANVVAISARRVGTHYNVDRFNPAVLHVPVDLEDHDPSERTHRSAPCIGLIGNWNPLKGQNDFLDVVERLSQRGINVQARMMGKLLESQQEYWEPIMKRLEGQGLKDRVDVKGFISNIPEALKEIDILLITSVSESGPMACIEAMASSVPVVSYDVGDVNNMLDPSGDDPGGFVVPVGGIEEMISACEKLLDNLTLLVQMGANGQRRAAKYYSLNSSAIATKAAYLRATNVKNNKSKQTK